STAKIAPRSSANPATASPHPASNPPSPTAAPLRLFSCRPLFQRLTASADPAVSAGHLSFDQPSPASVRPLSSVDLLCPCFVDPAFAGLASADPAPGSADFAAVGFVDSVVAGFVAVDSAGSAAAVVAGTDPVDFVVVGSVAAAVVAVDSTIGP